jgi:hypothetical protein
VKPEATSLLPVTKAKLLRAQEYISSRVAEIDTQTKVIVYARKAEVWGLDSKILSNQKHHHDSDPKESARCPGPATGSVEQPSRMWR